MKIKTVLLADDHAVVRAGIRNALQELAQLHVLAEVGDGRSLLAALAEQTPDLLLIDVTMPHFEPITAVRHMRSQYPALKILVVSAYDDDVYVQGLLGAGVDGYHLKDEPLSDLRLAVQHVLAGERWVSARLRTKLLATAPVTVPELTSRQREILYLLTKGLDNCSIAKQTQLSIKTIENHLTRLYRLLGVQSRLEAVHYVHQHPAVLGGTAEVPALIDANGWNEQAALTVLLVDDNGRYRTQLRRMVHKAQAQATVYEAETIAEALNLAQRVQPQLVLVDVILGDEDGIVCTQQLKPLLAPTARLVLISAYPDREFHRLGLAAGAIAFLDKKDLDGAALRQIVEDMTVL